MVNTITFVNTFLKTDTFTPSFPLNLFTDPYLKHAAYHFWTNSISAPLSYLLSKATYSSQMSYSDFKVMRYLYYLILNY
jgi:hypothetical protein